MELQQFIRQSLVEIMKGIEQAQKDLLGNSQSRICPQLAEVYGASLQNCPIVGVSTENSRPIHLIEYDVAVEVMEGRETGALEGEGSIGIFRAKANGPKSSRDSKDAARLKFSIPVSFPDINGRPGSGQVDIA